MSEVCPVPTPQKQAQNTEYRQNEQTPEGFDSESAKADQPIGPIIRFGEYRHQQAQWEKGDAENFYHNSWHQNQANSDNREDTSRGTENLEPQQQSEQHSNNDWSTQINNRIPKVSEASV